MDISYIIKTTAYILKESTITFKLYFSTLLLSIPLGLVLSMLSTTKFRFLKVGVGIYTWVFRGTPLILQLFFFYYGLGILGFTLKPFAAALLTFVLNYAAYFAEIFRGGIESIESGQYEASRALSMSYPHYMGRIIIPQMVKRSLPALSNEAINLVKDSALVIVIGLGDILKAAKEILTRDFTIVPFIIAAIIYLILTSVIVLFFRYLEKKIVY